MRRKQSISTEQHSFRRTVVASFSWLFIALAMLALLSPPGVSDDELYHAASIWCAYGDRDPYCKQVGSGGATTSIDLVLCQKPVGQPLICPTGRSGFMGTGFNGLGLYPELFYRTLGVFVLPSYEVSFVLLRFVNALIGTTVLGVAVLLFPPRYRTALCLMTVSIFNPFMLYLFASLNPSSWATIGVGFAWMAVHATFATKSSSKRQRLQLMCVAILFAVMALGSRWDAGAYLLFSLVVVLAQRVWSRSSKKRFTILVALTLAFLFLFVLLEKVSALKVSKILRNLFVYVPGEPDNLAFATHHVLQSVPRALQSLGQVSAQTGIYIPQIVALSGILVLVFVGVLAFNRSCRWQVIGVAASLALSSMVAMAWQALEDDRDPFNPSTRYVYPLTVFAVGWFYVHGPENLAQRVYKHLSWITKLVTFAFGLTVLAIAERNVDFQTWGVRLIPEGPDQWWWSWMPVGPNVVVLVAVLSMWQFLRRLPRVITETGV